jgi:ATP phosphoribosyltransferase regulatory subunit
MEASGISPTSSRSPEEIARRLLEKTELRSVRLADAVLDALKRFLDIRVSLDAAPTGLKDFAKGAGLSLGAALSRFSERAEKIAANGLARDTIHYDAKPAARLLHRAGSR